VVLLQLKGMSGFLSTAERAELRSELRLERYAKYSDRIKCILLLDSGKSVNEIAEFLFLSPNSIRSHLKSYQAGGLEGLVCDNYQGSQCRLTHVQKEELSLHLTENLYQTIASIRDYILKTYTVKYSLSGLRSLLSSMDFVYKKPKAVPGKADRLAQEEFLRDIEQKLKENPDKVAVYYADGVHPQHNTHCSYGWIKRGENKEIKTNTGRQRMNINGAINANNPTDVIIEEATAINAQSTIALLKKIEKRNPNLEIIYLVADNARYYRCTLVNEYLRSI
jgi:transposase